MKQHILTTQRSITEDMEALLNKQLLCEAEAAATYLAMATWAEQQGYGGAAAFLHAHAEEERAHMMRILRYITEAGGRPSTHAQAIAPANHKSLRAVFEAVLEQELAVSRSINELATAALSSGDHTTHHFLGWFLAEQREEEAMARQALGLFEQLGEAPQGMFFIDQQLAKLAEAHGEDA